MSMLRRLRATKRALSRDENSGDCGIQKITKKAATSINPRILSRSAILPNPPSSTSTSAFLHGPTLHITAAKHPRVLAISESEAWFGKTMMPNRQPRAEGYHGSPLANNDGDIERTASRESGLASEDAVEPEGVVAGHHADTSAHGTAGAKALGLGGHGKGGDVEMQDAKDMV